MSHIRITNLVVTMPYGRASLLLEPSTPEVFGSIKRVLCRYGTCEPDG